MKIFLQVCRNFDVVGIQSDQKHSLNWKNALALFFYGQFAISTLVFLCTEAKRVEEFSFSFYAFATCVATIGGIWSSIWKMDDIFEWIADIEHFIEKSMVLGLFQLI